MTPRPTPFSSNHDTLNPSRILVLGHGGAKLDTPSGNYLFFYPFCPLDVAEEREKDEGCCQRRDGNPPSDNFGEHQLQGLALGVSRCVRCLGTPGRRHPLVRARCCTLGSVVLHHWGKLRQGIRWQDPPGWRLLSDF